MKRGGWELVWKNSGGYGYEAGAIISNQRLRNGERRVSPVTPPQVGNRTSQASAMSKQWEAKAASVGVEWLKVVDT